MYKVLIPFWLLFAIIIVKDDYVEHVVDDRMKNLGLMEYNAEQNKMVIPDSLEIDRWDLMYIKHGTMNPK